MGIQIGPLQQIPEDPFVNPPAHARRQIKEANPTLSVGIDPPDFAPGGNLQAGMRQFEPYPQTLSTMNRSCDLHCDAIVSQIANYAAVRFIEPDVGHTPKFMPSASPPQLQER